MKISPRLALLMFCAVQCTAYAESNVAIDDVTLYPGSATIGRVAHVTPGMSQLEIKGLPANFDKRTIRVQSEPGIHVGQVVTQDSATSDAPNPREGELLKKIQALQDKEAALDVQAKSAALVQHYLESLNNGGVAERSAAMDAKSMAGVIETIHHSATEAFDSMQKVALQKRELDEQISVLQRDRERMKSEARDERSIIVALNVHQTGAVRVSYQVNDAAWNPAYRATLDSQASSMELERLATITQTTGEDWRNVKLTLSTGQPRLSPNAPNPQPWLLSYKAPMAEELRSVAQPAPSMASRVEITGSSYKRTQDADVIALQGMFDTQFDVPTRVNLPSDGREITVNLSAQALSVKQVVRVVPRSDTNAVITAVAQRPEGVWLRGQVQLYRDGNYVGVAQWNAQDDGALTFPFGRDDLVRVTVDVAKQLSGTAGFLGQHQERHVADVYTISSAHKVPVELLVLEAAPVSTSEEVKVESVFLPKPTIDSWEQRRGVVGWEKTLGSNEQMKISVDYSITYPKEGATAGLP